MKLILKESPKEWRKSVLITLPALVLLSLLLLWRHVLNLGTWAAIMASLGTVAVLACLFPNWFRCYYRISMRVGFVMSQVVARVLLVLIFAFLITPLGIVFRIMGKDPLRLKRSKNADSYWGVANSPGPLDRMF